MVVNRYTFDCLNCEKKVVAKDADTVTRDKKELFSAEVMCDSCGAKYEINSKTYFK